MSIVCKQLLGEHVRDYRELNCVLISYESIWYLFNLALFSFDI